MKLIAQTFCGQIFKHPDDSVEETVFSALHGLAILLEQDLPIFRYSFDGYAYSAPYKGQLVDIHVNNTLPGDTLSLENGDDYLLPKNIIEDLPWDEQYAIYRNIGEVKDVFLASRFTNTDETERKLYVVQSNNSELIHAIEGLGAYQAHYVDNQLFYLKRAFFEAYDNKFKPLWRFDMPSESFNPPAELNPRDVISHKDTVIANFYVDPNNNYAGSIYCWGKVDGSVRWTCNFDIDVQDLRRLNSKQLLAVAGNQLVVINAADGKVEKKVETGLDELSDHKALNIHENVISLHCVEDNRIQFYRCDNFNLLREVDCSAHGFALHRYQSTLLNNQLFIPCIHDSNSYWQFCSSVLMIDLNNVHAKLEIEQSPKFDIQLPDSDNGAIRLSVNHPDWGDIVRFAERHFIELVFKHGKGWQDPKSNPYFNGQLELAVRGCAALELTDKLEVLEKRVVKIIEDDDLHDKPVSVRWVIDN